MLLAIWWLRESTFFFLAVPLGAAVYIGLVLAFRALPDDDLTIIKEALSKLIARLPFIGRKLKPAQPEV